MGRYGVSYPKGIGNYERMKRAGDLLSAFLDERVMKKAEGYSQLFSSWPSIAGDQYSAHSRIYDLSGTLLVVEADHPGWVQILQTRQSDLLKKVQAKFPNLTITGISFRLCKEPRQSVPEKQSVNTDKQESVLDDPDIPNEQADTSSLYANIKDESFKESLKRLEESIKLRNKR